MKVTPGDVQDAIRAVCYFNAFDALNGKAPVETKRLTLCVLVLQNGYVVTGESACAGMAEFDAEIGMKVAREDAESKIWPLLGYQLREKLNG
jgi:hypothetical protein